MLRELSKPVSIPVTITFIDHGAIQSLYDGMMARRVASMARREIYFGYWMLTYKAFPKNKDLRRFYTSFLINLASKSKL